METTVNTNPDKQELRKFGLVFAGMFILIFGLLLPWIWDKPSPTWPWIVAAVFVATALLVPMALGPVYRLWMKIGHVLCRTATAPTRQGHAQAAPGCIGHNLSYSKRATASRSHGETVLMLDLLIDLWGFLKVRKKFWLAPIILVLVLLGALIVLSQGSAVAPFIYTLF
jgi:hypothetical protein